MGIHQFRAVELASIDVALAHVRLPTLRAEPRAAACNQCVVACRQRPVAVLDFAESHPVNLAKFDRLAHLRRASAERRDGCMDRPEKKSAQRVLQLACCGGLRVVCAPRRLASLSATRSDFRDGSAGQANGGEPACAPSAFRLLATASLPGSAVARTMVKVDI